MTDLLFVHQQLADAVANIQDGTRALQLALHGSSCLTAHVILPLIDRAARLSTDLAQLRAAIVDDEVKR